MFKFFKKRKKIRITGECLCCGKCCQNLILIDKGKPITHIGQFIKLKKKKQRAVIKSKASFAKAMERMKGKPMPPITTIFRFR